MLIKISDTKWKVIKMVKNNGSYDKKNGKVKSDRTTWIIGGTTMLGLGVGFFLLPISGLYFVASLLIGIGAGIVLVPLISKVKNNVD